MSPNDRKEFTNNKTRKAVPPVPEGLLRRLEQIYPDQLPRDRHSPEDLTFLQGQQNVLDQLRQWYEKQEERGFVPT